MFNFDTKQIKLIKSGAKTETLTEEEKVVKSLFVSQDADEALAEFEAEKD